MHPQIFPIGSFRVPACAILSAALLLSGCGGSPVGPTSQSYRFVGNLEVGFFGPTHEITAASDGVVTATLTWAEPRADLNLRLTEGHCGVFCHVFSSSFDQHGPLKQVSTNVRSGERYGVEIVNETRTLANSYTLEVVVR